MRLSFFASSSFTATTSPPKSSGWDFVLAKTSRSCTERGRGSPTVLFVEVSTTTIMPPWREST